MPVDSSCHLSEAQPLRRRPNTRAAITRPDGFFTCYCHRKRESDKDLTLTSRSAHSHPSLNVRKTENLQNAQNFSTADNAPAISFSEPRIEHGLNTDSQKKPSR